METIWRRSSDFLHDIGGRFMDAQAMNTTLVSTPHTQTTRTAPTAPPEGHRWQEAGDAWGRRATDWAALFEHYALDVIVAAFGRLGVGPEVELLDIACGSGLAIRLADGAGATVSGIDAAASLIEIATARTPHADIRVGDMFELPWADESFDVVTSINGIWGGCEAALAEAHRVLRPGGSVAISFWGNGHLDLRAVFGAFAANMPEANRNGMKRTNGIARPGVAEDMLTEAGFDVIARDGRVSTIEWPDADTAWRAMASLGPAIPALEAVGHEALRPQVMAALEPLRDATGLYRMRNDHQFLIARKR